jgi:hypothetical protein
VVEYPISVPCVVPEPFEATVEERPGGNPDNVFVFVRRLRTDAPSGPGLAVIMSEVNAGHVIFVSLREGEATQVNSEGMTAWCSSVEHRVRTAVEGLPNVVKVCGVAVAGPIHVAYATGRGLASVASGRMYTVTAFDETSWTGSREDATYTVAFRL